MHIDCIRQLMVETLRSIINRRSLSLKDLWKVHSYSVKKKCHFGPIFSSKRNQCREFYSKNQTRSSGAQKHLTYFHEIRHTHSPYYKFVEEQFASIMHNLYLKTRVDKTYRTHNKREVYTFIQTFFLCKIRKKVNDQCQFKCWCTYIICVSTN